MKTKLLKGVRVIDFSRILVGAYTSMMLADMGAEVIKIEPPNGDETRTWGPPFKNKDSVYYLSINRNKKSIALNLKHPEAQKIAQKLINTGDIMLENFTYGKMKEFNLGYEDVIKHKPDIIYTTVNSYGNLGEMRNKPAFDLIIQAYTGIMNITGGADTEPFKVGYPLCDILTGAHIYSSILAALLYKEKTGEGQYINSSLLECNIFAMPTIVSAYLNAGINARRKGNDHPNCSPYTLFKVSDGYISIGVATDYQFEKLCKLLNILNHMETYKSNTVRIEKRDELKNIIQDAIDKIEYSTLIKQFDSEGIPWSKINTMKDIFDDNKQIQDLGLIKNVHTENYGDLKYIRNPITYSKLETEEMKSPPKLGEHTVEVLKSIGYKEDDIQYLTKNNIIFKK